MGGLSCFCSVALCSSLLFLLPRTTDCAFTDAFTDAFPGLRKSLRGSMQLQLRGGAPVKQQEQPADAPQKKATTNAQDEDEIDPISVLRRVKAAIKAAKTDKNENEGKTKSKWGTDKEEKNMPKKTARKKRKLKLDAEQHSEGGDSKGEEAASSVQDGKLSQGGNEIDESSKDSGVGNEGPDDKKGNTPKDDKVLKRKEKRKRDKLKRRGRMKEKKKQKMPFRPWVDTPVSASSLRGLLSAAFCARLVTLN